MILFYGRYSPSVWAVICKGEIVYKKFFKRFFDIITSLIAILLTALPLLVICIIVKCESKGPAIFKGERVGKDGKLFKCYKVRTMNCSAPKDCASKDLDSDKYITKVGKFLRKSSLDELPQFYNVLKGDMSIVGPRPACPSEKELNGLREKNGSLTVRPGVPGLAQVNGRDVLAFNIYHKAEMDGEYVKDITLWKDLKIFFKTFIVVFKADCVVEGQGKQTDVGSPQPKSEIDQTVAEEVAVQDAQEKDKQEAQVPTEQAEGKEE